MEGKQKLPHSPDQRKLLDPDPCPKTTSKIPRTFPRQNTLCSDHCWKFGRAQRLPPRRIADDHDGGLCFEPVVVPASGNLLLFPPLGVFRSRLLQMKYYCYCFRCWKGGVLVAVIDAPVEGRLKKVLVVHCCCGYCGWSWCWWCWCLERKSLF